MGERRFDYWVVLAGMRTGSNLLEEHLAAFPEIESHGELFNPHFFGKPDQDRRFDLSIEARNADPIRVIGAMRSTAKGLPGFRIFYDHDPRAIAHVLAEPRCAKIVLTRRAIDSYVSLKIARRTGQWWLGDMTSAKAAKVAFDAGEYTDFLDTLTGFQSQIAHTLQVTGQTAFQLSYDDLADPDVIAGLGRFLGLTEPQDPDRIRAKVQNPTPVSERLTNASAAEDMLRALAIPDIGQVPLHEPGRGPGLKFFRACRAAPLLYMPVRGAGFDPVPDWLQSIDPDGDLVAGMTQKDLRRWKRQHPGHRSFTVLRHPLNRAHDAFCRYILPTNEDAYADVRAALVSTYQIPLPSEWPTPDWSIEQHREVFLAFLEFLKGNLGGQTSVRVDNTWASQATLLHAIGQFAIPDRVIREDNLADGLVQVAADADIKAAAPVGVFGVSDPFTIGAVMTPEIATACEAAYRRDYMMFGFPR